ncbi:hypothetical protein [Lysinibacillus sphaericus]|uniref:hypothetical protein n=1 Tax=Lysinibacillus sphaericus TaxID=1421 RepID=UPI0019D5693B|nr:hypothetical protein [Lysinibacillus sphaericus]
MVHTPPTPNKPDLQNLLILRVICSEGEGLPLHTRHLFLANDSLNLALLLLATHLKLSTSTARQLMKSTKRVGATPSNKLTEQSKRLPTTIQGYYVLQV